MKEVSREDWWLAAQLLRSEKGSSQNQEWSTKTWANISCSVMASRAQYALTITWNQRYRVNGRKQASLLWLLLLFLHLPLCLLSRAALLLLPVKRPLLFPQDAVYLSNTAAGLCRNFSEIARCPQRLLAMWDSLLLLLKKEDPLDQALAREKISFIICLELPISNSSSSSRVEVKSHACCLRLVSRWSEWAASSESKKESRMRKEEWRRSQRLKEKKLKWRFKKQWTRLRKRLLKWRSGTIITIPSPSPIAVSSQVQMKEHHDCRWWARTSVDFSIRDRASLRASLICRMSTVSWISRRSTNHSTIIFLWSVSCDSRELAGFLNTGKFNI